MTNNRPRNSEPSSVEDNKSMKIQTKTNESNILYVLKFAQQWNMRRIPTSDYSWTISRTSYAQQFC